MELVASYLSAAATEAQPQVDSYETQYEQERGKPMPSKNHAILQGEIYYELRTQFGTQFDILPELSLDLVSGRATPDLCIYEKLTRDWRKDVIKTKEPPIMAIEILSPKQNFNDITDKINDIYFPAGVKSVWVVLPQVESFMLFKPNEKTNTYNEGIFKDDASGFEVDLDKIFK